MWLQHAVDHTTYELFCFERTAVAPAYACDNIVPSWLHAAVGRLADAIQKYKAYLASA